MFEQLTVLERIEMARFKIHRVVDHLLYLLELHENNAIIVYSPTLSSQIPNSYAASAFKVFQNGLHHFEIVRLCALWDRAGEDKENIPTAVELIGDPDVIEALAVEIYSHYESQGTRLLNPHDEPEIIAIEKEVLQERQKEFALTQLDSARNGLTKAITDARSILGSRQLEVVMNMRDKHLAHSLSQTRREKSTGPIAPMEYGDERDILLASLPIVEALYCWVIGVGFSFEDIREINREHAEALWCHCTFDIEN